MSACGHHDSIPATTAGAALAPGPARSRRHGMARRLVLNLSPNWFSVNMGTGIASILLYNLPYNGTWLWWLSVVIFALNVALFLAFLALSIARYTMFRGLWSATLNDPVQSLYLGTFPMGLATIINMLVFVCVPAWGAWVVTLAWVLWWIDVALAVATNLYVPYAAIQRHASPLSSMTAEHLLPIISTIVASASGGILASVQSADDAQITILTSYLLWGSGSSFALLILGMYLQRSYLYGPPPSDSFVTAFLPLGPLGQGSFAIQQLGKEALRIFPLTHTLPAAPLAGQIFYATGVLAALVMWGSSLVWLVFALAMLRRASFHLSRWACVFPTGVYALATVSLSAELPSPVAKVVATILALAAVLLWLAVSLSTVLELLQGRIARASDLVEWQRTWTEKRAAAETIDKNSEQRVERVCLGSESGSGHGSDAYSAC